MRVTGGEFSGRRLSAPRQSSVRPTADRVRESLFARLGDLADQRVLDLFAGSGSLGIEAMSRGAETAVFVDQTSSAASCIRANLEQLGLEGRGTVIRSSVLAGLARLEREGQAFDLLLVDPPYASGEALAVLERLAGGDFIEPDGLVVLETHRRHDPGPVEGLRRTDERRYGDTLVVWYEPDASTSPDLPPEGSSGRGDP